MTRRCCDVAGRCLTVIALGAGVASVSCGPAARETKETMANDNAIIRLLAAGQPVFGVFSGDHTGAQGALMAQNKETDFVFYSLEEGPFDIPAMETYMQGLADSAGADGPHTLVLRIPPIRDGHDVAREHIQQGLAAGVDGIVFPHVASAADAALGIEAMGENMWPLNPAGNLVNIMIIEDQEGIAHAREIVATPGVGVAIPGPGDLRRAYNGDMEAVEHAIQTVLAACKELNVPCGITAGVDDIGKRLEEGFRLIIVTRPEALAVGLKAAGRVTDR
jgi:2-keto-3-deoxy-L-rhamnonate aldolase RhmA